MEILLIENVFLIGLAIIIVGWILQLYKNTIKKDWGLSMYFLVLYAIGCIFLSAGNFLLNDVITGILNMICIILVAIIIITLLVRKKKKISDRITLKL